MLWKNIKMFALSEGLSVYPVNTSVYFPMRIPVDNSIIRAHPSDIIRCQHDSTYKISAVGSFEIIFKNRTLSNCGSRPIEGILRVMATANITSLMLQLLLQTHRNVMT